MSVVRIALVGYGRWGRNHARVLATTGRLAAIVDPDPAQRAAACQRYPQTQTLADLSQLCWPEIDGVIIASPIEHHVSQALAVLEQEKHCFVEKPLALDLEDVERLAALAEAVPCLLVTGHILDFHPGTRELVRLCQNNRLGRLRYWHSSRARLVPPRTYFSVVEELLWHDLSVLLRVTGRLPDTVRTTGSLQEEGALFLDFGDFCALLRGSQIQSRRESSILIGGECGILGFDDERSWNEKLQLLPHNRAAQAILLPSVEPLAAEIEHFVAAASCQITPLNGAKQAQEILTIIEMARQSCTARSWS